MVFPHHSKQYDNVWYVFLANTTNLGYLEYKVLCVCKPKENKKPV